MKLISPVSERFGARISAPRAPEGSPLSILLVDGMLNQKAGWGQALLDGVEQALEKPGFRRFERLIRSPHGSIPPEEWAHTRSGKTDLAVIAVGD